MSLEDLDFKINIDAADSNKALRGLNTQLVMATDQSKELNTKFGGITVGKMETAQTALKHIHSEAVGVQIELHHLQAGFAAAAVAAQPLAMIHGRLGVVSHSLRMVSHGVEYLGAAFGLVATLAVNMAVGIGVLLAPLKVLLFIPPLIAAAFGVMFAVILAPFKLLIGLAALAAKGIMAVLSPILAITAAAWRLKVAFQGFQLQLILIRQLLGVLPPKIAAVVAGLFAIGVAGRAGGAAMTALAVTFRLVIAPIRMLTTMLYGILHPIAGAKIAVKALAINLAALAVTAYRGAAAMFRFAAGGIAQAASGLMSFGTSVLSAAGSIGGKLLSMVVTATKALLVMGAVSVAWGVKLAVGAETATVVFGTMLKSMDQGRALMRELEQWEGASLFDPKQVQDAGRDLFKAGVPVTQLIGRLDQLGQIAVATKTPIEDLSRIYRQGMAKGAFQTDLVNQMAERGIDIYHALEAVTGKSGLALAKAMKGGKIGADEMNAAIAHLTTGQGIYAGAVANVAQTTGGLWSKMKSEIGFAAREIGINVIAAFDFKGLLARGGELFKSLRGWIRDAMPAFTAVAIVVQSAFAAVWEVVGVVFSAITSALGLTGGNWLESFVTWAAVAAFAFKAWPDLAELAFTKLGLWLVQAGSGFIHLFTGILPALFKWFGENWQDILFSAGDLVATVFINIGQNIRNAMSAIWDFIKSGGTSSLSIAFVPLLDGFHNTIRELPDIPPRAISALEHQLQADSLRLGSALSTGLAAEIDSNLKMLEDYRTTQANLVEPELTDAGQRAESDMDAGTDAASKKAVENKASAVRSGEGQSAIQQILYGVLKSDDEKKKTKATIEMAKDMKTVAREVQRGKPLQARAFAHG